MIGIVLVLGLIFIGVKIKNEKQEEQETLLQKQFVNAERILRDVAATGEVVIQDGSVIITDLNFNETELLLRINYYNTMEEKSLTLEQAKEQFEIYTINYEFLDESTDELKNFCAFIEEEGMMSRGACYHYDEYVYKVLVILPEMGTSIQEATREQLEEACQKALEE